MGELDDLEGSWRTLGRVLMWEFGGFGCGYGYLGLEVVGMKNVG